MLSYTFPTNGRRSALLPLERLLGGQTQASQQQTSLAPPADIIENADGVLVRLAMPGAKADDIDVHVEKSVLTIKAHRPKPEAADGIMFHLNELNYGAIRRSFKVPIDVDIDAVTAAYVDGMLTITLPKAEKSRPRTIKVETT